MSPEPRPNLVSCAIVNYFTVVALCAWPQFTTLASTPPEGSFGRFKHTGWTEEDGAPTMNNGVVRGADGFLYVASSRNGLNRFDGYSFEKVPEAANASSRSASVVRLLVGRDGELWVGYGASAGVGVMMQGRMQDTGMINPPPQITELEQTKDGTIWAAYGGHGRRLWRFAHGAWQCMDDLLALPDGFITSIVASRDGGLWLALLSPDNSHGSLFFLPANKNGLQPEPDAISFARMGMDPRGRLWVVDRLGVRILRDADGRRPARPTMFTLGVPLRIARFSFDSAGALWGSTGAANIFRIAAAGDETPSGPVDHFGSGDGLTSDFANDISVDHEGNVWVSTSGGLDRFRRQSVTRVPSIPTNGAEGIDIARAKTGDVYVTSAGQLFKIAPHDVPRLIKDGLSSGGPLCAAQDGGIWISGTKDIVHVSATTTTTTATTFARPTPEAGDGTCAEDREGRLWIGLETGLIWHDMTGWHKPTGWPGSADIWQTLVDQNGNLVFLIKNQGVGTLNGDQFAAFDEKELDAGRVFNVMIGERDVFVSGTESLVRLRPGSLSRLAVAKAPYVERLRDLIQTSDGATWMMSLDGISRVETTKLDRTFENADAPLDRKLFNTKDGLQGSWQHQGYRGTQSAQGQDGRLWFLSSSGLMCIDPSSFPKNSIPPKLVIESINAGGRTYFDIEGGTHLPPGTTALDISFAALSLVAPERNQYRYQLDGVEKEWVDPGQRHVASYANLGAGKYVFHLRAANNDGIWSPHEATASFVIEPTFIQSSSFKFLCGLVVATLLWLAYSLRLRAVTARVRLGMEERLMERERIARELHDTLLQAITGLMLRFEVAARSFPQGSPTRGKIDDALNLADKVIAEGRDRVRDLRTEHQVSSFEAAVRSLADTLLLDDMPECEISLVGQPRSLEAAAHGEALSIVRESLVNAHRHANARRISIVLHYSGAKFEVSIGDDGIGIEQEFLNNGGREGHYGLTGMRERARKLGGTLQMERLDPGTRITLRIPGSVAYTTLPKSST
jgi:signal transduction histidine kinase/ligand-binding sensor domain-containing protein